MFALAGSACSYNLFYNELTRKREVSLKMWTSKDKHFRYNTGFDWNDPRAQRLTGSAKYNHFWAPRAWKDDLQLLLAEINEPKESVMAKINAKSEEEQEAIFAWENI